MNKDNHFKNKKILITGNTGFKGSWLSIWLKILGGNLFGLSNSIPTQPSLYEKCNLDKLIDHNFLEISDTIKVISLINKIQPDYIFHLAAQPLVNYSYSNPVETWKTNVIGTVNILEAMRMLKNECVGIIITSDKCYANQEWEWGYRECDKLGGSDPYSASKGAAEIAFSSYYQSYFSNNEKPNIKIASARAGNVIGGGDWAKNRIVPDCMRAWQNNMPVIIRSPYSTRPFQHVLEPLSGYISLAKKLKNDSSLSGQSFNFGPSNDSDHKVIDVVKALSKYWQDSSWEINQRENLLKESKLLKLNCDKALSLLKWKPNLNFSSTMKLTSSWYYDFYKKDNLDVFKKCCEQIEIFNN